MDTNLDIPTPPADTIGGIPNLARHQRAADEALSEVNQSESQLTNLAQQQASELAGREKQIDSAQSQQPPNLIGYAMKQSPILMALAALAGGHSRSFGLTALGSLNGMVQGIQKGSQQEYEDAEKKYQDALRLMQERWKLRDQVYASLEKAYGTTMQGNLRRWQIAEAAIGNDEKIAQDTFNNRLDIVKFENTVVDQERKRKEELAKIIETHRHNVAGEKSKGGNLSERAASILAEVTAEGIPLPTGSRSAQVLGAVFNAIADNHPDDSPEDIAHRIKNGEIDMKQLVTESTVVARREGNVSTALAAMTEKNGIFDQLDSVAKKLNFGDSKTISQIKLAFQGKAVANEDIQEYRNLIEDAKAEMAQVLTRSGQTTDMVRRSTEEMFPTDASYPELKRVMQRGVKVAKAIQSGNKAVMDSLKSGKSILEVEPLVDSTTGGKIFSTEAEAKAAADRGDITIGDSITVAGQTGKWQ